MWGGKALLLVFLAYASAVAATACQCCVKNFMCKRDEMEGGKKFKFMKIWGCCKIFSACKFYFTFFLIFSFNFHIRSGEATTNKIYSHGAQCNEYIKKLYSTTCVWWIYLYVKASTETLYRFMEEFFCLFVLLCLLM